MSTFALYIIGFIVLVMGLAYEGIGVGVN